MIFYSKQNICPVCGYDRLDEPAYDSLHRGSFGICSCCGFQFGVDDDDKGFTHISYRNQWMKNGAKWFDVLAKPDNWSLDKQLLNIINPNGTS